MAPISRRTTLGLLSATALTPLMSGCATQAEVAPAAGNPAFDSIAMQALDGWARLNPASATLLGDHRFDGEIEDQTDAGRAQRNQFRAGVVSAVEALDRTSLSHAQQVDAAMLVNRMRYENWLEGESQMSAWHAVNMGAIVGGSLYSLMSREFAPLPERLLNAAARMEKLPETLAQIRAGLDPSRVARVNAETWQRQNPGTASIIDGMILPQAAALNGADRTRLQNAAERLKAALTENQRWIDETLVPNAQGDFRVGQRLYDQQLALALDSPMSREEIKAAAIARRDEIYAEMAEIAGSFVTIPANERWTQQRLIAQGLEAAAAERPARDGVVAACEATLAEATEFTRANNIVTLPDAPVNIILMPEFQRGVAVAYCDPPGPLDQGQPTFFAVSPIPDDWDDDRATSFLREYNNYMIHELCVHEGVPGHYLQLWHSNRYPSLTRAAFFSGPFVEGWACYAQDMMIAEGYRDGNPLQRLTNHKMALRAVTNALLDIGVHVEGMTQEQAMEAMTVGAFQEEREAAGKWIRACVTSAQLPTYFVGQTEHWALRREAQSRAGAGFSLKTYHDTLLSFGSPPVRHARALLFNEPIA